MNSASPPRIYSNNMQSQGLGHVLPYALGRSKCGYDLIYRYIGILGKKGYHKVVNCKCLNFNVTIMKNTF